MTMDRPIRVLAVDDSPFVRKALIRAFSEDPLIELAGTAENGKEAVRKALELKPDVITLDIMMPSMDGLEALELIMRSAPVPVVMLSQLTREGAELTLKALELGAMDFVDKSAAGAMDFFSGLGGEIISKVKAVAGHKPQTKHLKPEASVSTLQKGKGLVDAVLIGASTGGPPALQSILEKMPADIDFGILVVQHMPVGFIRSLASRLDSVCRIKVKEAEDGERVRPGAALIAPSGIHMKIKNGMDGPLIALDLNPPGSLHRPSVDVLFESAADTFGKRCIGVVLTGMGNDGSQGVRAVKEGGGMVIVQDEASSVIFSMPRAAAETGCVDIVLPVSEIAGSILENS
jgi:two-component system chemotaxis response regulator CheB